MSLNSSFKSDIDGWRNKYNSLQSDFDAYKLKFTSAVPLLVPFDTELAASVFLKKKTGGKE